MKHRILKVVACISLIAMVLSAVMPGALADETGTTDAKEFGEHPMRHGPGGNPRMNDDGAMEAMEFDSDEEEMEFIVDRETEHINNMIERLTERLADLEEDSEEYETISEEIENLEALLEDIEKSTTIDELKERMEEARGNMMDMKGDRPGMEGMEKMEFESDAEEMEFLVEIHTERINNRIVMSTEILENLDEDSDRYEAISEEIGELGTLLEDIEEATTFDELKEILEEYRENNPRPHRHEGEHRHGPVDDGSDEE